MNKTTVKCVVVASTVVTGIIAKRKLSKMFADAVSNEPTTLPTRVPDFSETFAFVK